MNLSDLKPASYNPREISEESFNGLKTSIEEFGDLSGIVFNKRTGNLVAGHQRVKALNEQYGDLKISFVNDANGIIITPDSKEFFVRFVDWSEDVEKLANITANNPNIQGHFTPGLQIIIDELKMDSSDLVNMLQINQLEISPIDHVLEINTSAEKEFTKASLNFTIGEYTFKIPREKYLEWIESLKLDSGFSDNEVIEEIKRRLEIEN